MIELLEEGVTMRDTVDMPVTETLALEYFSDIDWDPKKGECRVWCDDGAYYDFHGISREKFEHLIYSSHPRAVLLEWLKS